jgi:4-hydroxybenzoate polyprenyltransferase
MTQRTGVGAWLELMRVGNSPTVASNVLAGMAVGLQARLSDVPVPFGTGAVLLVGTVMTYVAGMILNDAFDARDDARERPSRPIPSGRIGVARARFAGLATLAVGAAMLGSSGEGTLWWAVLLAGCVVLYNAAHAWFPGAFVVMAACRAMVPVIAALATSPGADHALLWWVAGGSFAYVAALGLVARNEVQGLPPVARLVRWTLPLAACAPLGVWVAEGVDPGSAALVTLGLASMAAAVVGVVTGVRLAASGRAGAVPSAVGVWIGAIPLVDAATCFLLGRPLLGLLCVAMFGLSGALRPRFAAS